MRLFGIRIQDQLLGLEKWCHLLDIHGSRRIAAAAQLIPVSDGKTDGQRKYPIKWFVRKVHCGGKTEFYNCLPSFTTGSKCKKEERRRHFPEKDWSSVCHFLQWERKRGRRCFTVTWRLANHKHFEQRMCWLEIEPNAIYQLCQAQLCPQLPSKCHERGLFSLLLQFLGKRVKVISSSTFCFIRTIALTQQ